MSVSLNEHMHICMFLAMLAIACREGGRSSCDAEATVRGENQGEGDAGDQGGPVCQEAGESREADRWSRRREAEVRTSTLTCICTNALLFLRRLSRSEATTMSRLKVSVL